MTLPGPEQTHVEVRLCGATAAQEARRFITELEPLRGRSSDLTFTAQLLTAEVVSNALRHAGTPDDEFVVQIDSDQNTVRIEVTDTGPGFNPLELLRNHDRNNEHHRGIALIDNLADRWGFRCQDGACRVWFELDLIGGRRPWRGREAARHRSKRS